MRKPSKRQPLKEVLIVFAGLIVLACVAVAIYWYHINALPAVVIPTPVMPKANAFDYFVAAEKLEVLSDDIDNAVTPGPIQHYKLVHNSVQISTSPEAHFTLAQKEELVRVNEPALIKLRQGFEDPYVDPPIRSILTPTPYYAKFHALARLLKLAGLVEEEKGDWTGAANDYLDAVQMGEKIPHGSTVTGRLIGTSCAAIGRKPLWTLVDHLTADEARAASLRLEFLRSQEDPLLDTFEQEKWTNQASLEELLKKPGYPASVLDAYTKSMLITMPPETRSIYLAEGRLTPKKKLMDDVTGYWNAQIRNAQLPNPMLATEPALPADWLNLLQDSALQGAFDNLGKNIALRTLDNQAQNALLETSLALRAYELDHGKYPTSLSGLVPGYLKEVPADPFSAAGRAPIRYRLKGSGYVLYSVGPDGKDDGGKPIFAKVWTDGSPLTGKRRYDVAYDSKGDIVAGVNGY